ncbi:tetratricopeptide repeat protein [Kitasatospora sp. NPDC051984]|uniref:tetratricopeptide repeat protein n=1 Tax=Kitasatospora sp. NPDC051984 TaxID=3364059 RepID=UPI0037C549EA
MTSAGPWPGTPVGATGQRAVLIAGSNYGQITTGDHSPITVTRLPPLRAIDELPPTAGPVGIPGRVQSFVGRLDALSRTARALAPGPGVVVHTVHGLGGVGKSALAAQYVCTHGHRYSQVVWLGADDTTAIAAGLRRFALALEPAASLLASEALVERALAWLSAHDGWLVVLDNATAADSLAPLLAGISGSGRFLITSRSSVGWQRIGADTQVLESLGAEESLRLLAASTGRGPAPPPGGREVCEALGHLPLAVVQAGAYLAQTATGAHAYLRLLAEQPVVAYNRGDEHTDPDRTIARIWRITLDRVADTPLVGEVLRVLAWLAPTGIPRRLLDGLAAEPELAHALGRLTAYSMIARRSEGPDGGGFLTVHRLVQAVARTPDPADPHRSPEAIARARTRATGLLVGAMPETTKDVRHWPVWRWLTEQIAALAEHADPATDDLKTAAALNQAGIFLGSQGDLATGIAFVNRARDGFRRLTDRADPDTLVCTNNLADLLREAGDARRAIRLFEDILDDVRRVFGEEDTRTLRVWTNLAGAQLAAGEAHRAIAVLKLTLDGYRRVKGDGHPDTVTCRESLAVAYSAAGDLARALPLLDRNLADYERILGPDHPNTLHSRSNVATAQLALGDIRRAVPQLKQALADSLRVLGPDHPDTLTIRNNLAGAFAEGGDFAQALPLLEQNLHDRRRIHAEDHPSTLLARHNLAHARLDAGDPEGALAMLAPVAADARRVLGEEHPTALRMASSLANAYDAVAEYGMAIELYRGTLATAVRVLGEDHPEVLMIRSGLGRTCVMAQDAESAIPLLEQTLAASRRVFGPDHPMTLTARSDLATARAECGGYDAIVQELEHLLADVRRVFGEEHSRTLDQLVLLADVYDLVGLTDRAVTAWRAARAISGRLRGEEHPDTRRAARCLAAALRAAGG